MDSGSTWSVPCGFTSAGNLSANSLLSSLGCCVLLLLLCYLQGSFSRIISPLGTKLPFPQCQPNVFQTQNMQSQIFEGRLMIKPGKKNPLLVFKQWKDSQNQDDTEARTPMGILREWKRKIKVFSSFAASHILMYHSTLQPSDLSNASAGFANTLSLRDGKAEKCKESVSAYRNYFSQQP